MLKADANCSKLKSKENTRHSTKAADVFCLLLEEHACFFTPTIGAVDGEIAS